MQITHSLANGQVLQRRDDQTATVTITGTVDASGTVAVTATSALGTAVSSVGVASSGAFTVTLSGIPIGGPYAVTLAIGDESLTVSDIYVGDVWILAGQSNMEGVGVLKGAAEPDPRIRALSMARTWAIGVDPLHWWVDSPDTAHRPDDLPDAAYPRLRQLREQSRVGVGPGLFFAAEMLRRTGVPQGLICTAHGGTSMEQWNPALKHLGGASMYGSMLRSVAATGQRVAGVLWYQGENETGAIEGVTPYTDRMVALVQGFRDDLGQPNLPFLVAQLGRYVANQPHLFWNGIQVRQEALPAVIDNLLCVATVDLALEDVIHISTPGNARLGVRFARAADRLAHANTAELPPPDFVSAVRVTDEYHYRAAVFAVDITFANVSGALMAIGEPEGFALVDDNLAIKPLIFKTRLRGNVVRIEAAMRDNDSGLKLMYGAGLYPHCNITDDRDMAIPVFGPVPIQESMAMSPYAIAWRVSDLQTPTCPIELQPLVAVDGASQTFPGPFVSMAATWAGQRGRAFFATNLVAPEEMDIRLRFGYDGPFRLWLDDAVVHTDPNGINPIIIDEHLLPIRLTQGTHRVTCAMDFTNAHAWGFVLRCDRADIALDRILAGDYAAPNFTVSD